MSFPNFYQPDLYCGTALRPGAEGWYTHEGKSYVRINQDGLHDRDHTRTKPPHTLRIAILGDSYAEAFQVPMGMSFWAVLERELARNPVLKGERAEVINFGVSGYGTALELLTLRHRVWKYSPDIVLLSFLTGNDVSDNSYALNHEDRTPYFVHRNGSLLLDDSYLEWFRSRQGPLARAYYSLLNHSRILRIFKEARYALDRRARGAHQEAVAARAGFSGEAGMSDMIYVEPRDPLWKEAWQITEELLGIMNKEVAANNARFLVVTLSNGIQVRPDRAVREKFARQLGVSDLFYPDRRIRAAGERDGFPVLNLAPLLQAYADKHQIFLHGFGDALGVGHWNAEGHAVAGRQIAEWIACLLKEQNGVPDGRLGGEPKVTDVAIRDCQVASE